MTRQKIQAEREKTANGRPIDVQTSGPDARLAVDRPLRSASGTNNVFRAFMNPAPAPNHMQLLKAFVDAPDYGEPAVSLRYVKRSLQRFLNDVGRTRMERAFELPARPSARSAARTFAERLYEQELLSAWCALLERDPKGAMTFPWGEVGRLLTEINEFEKLCWPQWRKSGLNRSASKIQSHLFVACDLAARFRTEEAIKKGLHPKTVKGLRDLLTRAAELT